MRDRRDECVFCSREGPVVLAVVGRSGGRSRPWSGRVDVEIDDDERMQLVGKGSRRVLYYVLVWTW